MAGALQNGCSSCPTKPKPKIYPKRLAAFDFDETIVEGNTDTIVRGLIDPCNIPSEVRNMINTDGWNSYMQEVFKLLHESNINEECIRKRIRDTNEVPGMIKLIKKLHNMNFDIIIISDANAVFIEEWCSAHCLNIFTKVYTNPAEFQMNGLLIMRPYHIQTDCKLSPENLCKGKILDNFIQERNVRDNIKYANIIYVGDGSNDICPMLRLSKNDYGCVRKNFGMDKRLSKNIKLSTSLEVKKLIKWSTGFDLLAELLKIF